MWVKIPNELLRPMNEISAVPKEIEKPTTPAQIPKVPSLEHSNSKFLTITPTYSNVNAFKMDLTIRVFNDTHLSLYFKVTSV